ncbi:amidohydrolase [Galactobacter valiniphilus]|uniref:amidohydrolase n=1 Tax=Galactobacter valiniphilus TaxID=2676122 RepID=UPI0037352EBA
MSSTLSPTYIVTGTIHTMDEEVPTAEAIGVKDGLIAAVGTLDQVRAELGGEAPVVEHSSAILPGLLDAHNHHAEAGKEDLFQLSFPATATVEQIIEAVAEYATTLPEGEWLVGGLWGSNLGAELATGEPLKALDAVTGDRPVLLTDDSHHNKWANTAAMRAAGILEMTEDPHGGQIIRDANGAPSGLLYEAAAAIVEQHRITTVTLDDEFHARCSERGIEMLAEHGIVAFQDAAAGLHTLKGLAKLDDEDRLKAWVVSSSLINDNIFGNEVIGEELLGQAAQYARAHHRPTWSKIFLDGVPPSRNAAFLTPYVADDEHGHDHLGATLLDFSELAGWLRSAQKHQIGIKIHCTGNAAVRLVLDAVADARAEGIEVPVHIAHGQFVEPEDRPRLAELGVVAEISPFLWFPGVIANALDAVLPEEVFAGIHPNRSLLDAGAHLAVGSDWPVSESPNPWHAVAGLVTRQDPSGQFPGTLFPEQAITREEAIAAVTSRSADAIGLGDVTGRLRVGNSADFVFLDRDPFEVPVEELAHTRAVATFFGGEQVFGEPVA